jgi:prevent-host-death family protein
MRKVALFEAKQKLSELVERAGRGERIGITKRGRLAAVIGPAQEQVDLKQVFAEIDKIRRRSKKVPGVTVKSLIEEGRTWVRLFSMRPYRSLGL